MNKKQFIYEGMNKEQIDILNKYTQFKTATKIQKNMVEIIGESEMIQDWVYDGYIDKGRVGGDHCSMGHALRYVHYARNKKTGEIIKFGIKCISDFFHITPQKLKMIQTGFIQVNEVVNEIVEKFKAGNYNFDAIETNLSKLNQLPNHFGEMRLLLDVKLPLPNHYEKEINEILIKENNEKKFQDFLKSEPELNGIIVMAQLYQDNPEFKNKHPELHKKLNDIIGYLHRNKKLSDSQVNVVKKIMTVNYDEMDNIIEDIKLIDPHSFLNFDNFDEYNVFKKLILDYDSWGLTIKQMELLRKIHQRHIKQIEKIKEMKLNKQLEEVY